MGLRVGRPCGPVRAPLGETSPEHLEVCRGSCGATGGRSRWRRAGYLDLTRARYVSRCQRSLPLPGSGGHGRVTGQGGPSTASWGCRAAPGRAPGGPSSPSAGRETVARSGGHADPPSRTDVGHDVHRHRAAWSARPIPPRAAFRRPSLRRCGRARRLLAAQAGRPGHPDLVDAGTRAAPAQPARPSDAGRQRSAADAPDGSAPRP